MPYLCSEILLFTHWNDIFKVVNFILAMQMEERMILENYTVERLVLWGSMRIGNPKRSRGKEYKKEDRMGIAERLV